MGVSQLDSQLIDALPILDGKRQLTILLGAGASVGSGLSSWNKMVEYLLCDSNLAKDAETAQVLVEQGDLVLLSEGARSCYESDAKWMKALHDALYHDALCGSDIHSLDQLDPSFLQLNAASLACEYPEQVHLVTLNFDTLLELAIDRVNKEIGSENLKKIEVTHLHGIIDPGEEAETNGNALGRKPVFTFHDYLSLIGDTKADARETLIRALEQGDLLIVGTSFRDPDIRQWLGKILKEQKRKENLHKTYFIASREGFKDVDVDEFSRMLPALKGQWESLGVSPIFVQDHFDAAQIIQELRYAGHPGYHSPAERINQIWEKLAGTEFASYQNEFSDLLQQQKRVLKRQVGQQLVNATLWIAHGDKMIRYATHDRLYRDASLLREREQGFDSAMIAGRVYSTCQQLVYGPTGRWRMVAAAPIIISDEREQGSYSRIPVAVVSFGFTEEVDRNTIAVALTKMVDEWSGLLSKSFFR